MSTASIDERVERALEVRRLKEEIESLKQDNNELRFEMMRELNKGFEVRARGESDKPLSEVSTLVVDELVEKHLSDPDTNLGAVPDFMERPAMRAMFLYMLKSMAHGVDTMKLEFFGHEIVAHMRPVRKPFDEVDEGDTDEPLPQYDSYHDEDYGEGAKAGSEESPVNAHTIPL
jgi:hypothetical protein